MNSSTRIMALNNFNAFWKPFIRVFQALAVSHHSIFRPNLRNHLLRRFSFLCYFLLISSIHVILVASTLNRGLQREQNLIGNRKPKHRESNLMYYINSMALIVYFATNITTHLETLFCWKQEQEIFRRLETINEIFATKLHHMIDFKARRTTYVRQIVCAFILSSILSSASAFSTLPETHHYKYFMSPVLIIAAILNRTRWCYVTIVLKALGDILNDLQDLLRQHQLHSCDESSNHPESHHSRENIRYYREIYSHIWMTAASISDCYGFTIITFLTKFTFESINTAYWLYINWMVYKSIELNIRKYEFVKTS